MKLIDKINEIKDTQEKEIYLRGVESLENIQKNSIDIFDDYMQELAGGRDCIESRLDDCGVAYSIEENNDNIIVEYDGSNVSVEFDNMITEQYEYIALVSGELQGENFHGDGDICKIEEIIAIFTKEGERIQ